MQKTPTTLGHLISSRDGSIDAFCQCISTFLGNLQQRPGSQCSFAKSGQTYAFYVCWHVRGTIDDAIMREITSKYPGAVLDLQSNIIMIPKPSSTDPIAEDVTDKVHPMRELFTLVLCLSAFISLCVVIYLLGYQ